MIEIKTVTVVLGQNFINNKFKSQFEMQKSGNPNDPDEVENFETNQSPVTVLEQKVKKALEDA